MHTASSPSLNRWRTLYQAAILETNKELLPERVSEAEEAVKARGRTRFMISSSKLATSVVLRRGFIAKSSS